MVKKISTISIGDLHGRNCWKSFADIIAVWNVPDKKLEYDYYVFMGDYADDFRISDKDMIDNLLDLITFKRNYPDNVVLLIGNHDLQYMFDSVLFGCSGYRPSIYKQLHKIYNDNIDFFQPFFQILDEEEEECYMWSHAGVTRQLYDELGCSWYNIGPKILECLGKSLSRETNPVYKVGVSRGGSSSYGGIFWADKEETQFNQIKGVKQIIGHTHIKKIEYIVNNTYIDSLGSETAGQENLPLILDIS